MYDCVVERYIAESASFLYWEVPKVAVSSKVDGGSAPDWPACPGLTA